MPFGIQPWHLIAVVIVALIVFGPARLPELGRSIGKALTEFRRGTREMTESFKEEINKPESLAQASAGEPTIAPPPQSVPTSPSQTPAAAANFCTSCGKANPPGARFCNSCGAQMPE